jgi:hypothetical protein
MIPGDVAVPLSFGLEPTPPNLSAVEIAADVAVRDVQRELRDVHAEIKLMPRRRLGARVWTRLRRARADR